MPVVNGVTIGWIVTLDVLKLANDCDCFACTLSWIVTLDVLK